MWKEVRVWREGVGVDGGQGEGVGVDEGQGGVGVEGGCGCEGV